MNETNDPAIFIPLCFICPHLSLCVCLNVWIIITVNMHSISSQTNKLPPKNYCSVSLKALPSSLSHWCVLPPPLLIFLPETQTYSSYLFLVGDSLLVAGVLWMVGVGLINSDSLLPPTTTELPTSASPERLSLCVCVCVYVHACVCDCQWGMKLVKQNLV